MKIFTATLSVLGVFFILFIENETPGNNVHGTKWISVISEGYVDTLSFDDSTYIFYSSELGSRFYGTYTTRKDTVKLIEIGEYAIFDKSYHPAGKPVKLYLMKRKEKIYYIKRYVMEDNVWIDSGYEFENRYNFTKLESE